MPKLLAGAAALALAGCATVTPPPGSDEIAVRGATPGHRCDGANVAQFVGLPRNDETGAAILRATNASMIRWAPMGMMLTMEYREDRVTVRLGPDSRITQVSCG